jgi:hypothetical protein
MQALLWAENVATDFAGKISCICKLVFDVQMGVYTAKPPVRHQVVNPKLFKRLFTA